VHVFAVRNNVHGITHEQKKSEMRSGCGEMQRRSIQSENRRIIPVTIATPWLTIDREAHAAGRLDVLSAWVIIKSEVPLFWVGRKVYVKTVTRPVNYS
jgi:hypothetical protein